MKLRYLHLSDLHLASIESKGPVQAFNQDVVSRSMVTAIKNLGSNFDFIVITGDIARAGQADEYEVCLVFCNALLEATGLDRQRLFIVPGNHDVDRHSITQKHIKSFYAFDDQDEITETFTDPDLFPILMRKFEGFNDFAAKAAEPKRFDASTCWFAETIRVTRSQEVCRIALAGLNSCLFAGYDKDDRQQLALGLYQVNQAQEQISEVDLSIALFHHPFFCYHPCDKVCRNLLIKNFDLILTGHLHDPSNLFTRDAAGQAVIIGAGAGFETREHHNSFNVVELDTNTGRGKVQFYKYLPDHNHWKKDTDVNPSEDDGGFSFKTGLAFEGGKTKEAGADEISEAHRTTEQRIDVKDSRVGIIGDGARVEGGIHFKEKTGGIHVADVAGDVTIYAAEAAAGKAEALREAYLNRVISDAGFLALKGIDPKAASIRTSTRLNLKAVYTALLTRRADLDHRGLQVKSEKQERLSALTLLDRHRHLVLLGDPGSGKSTFVNFVALCLAGEGLGRKDANIELMTAPLPDDEGRDSEQRQPWGHGPLLPVRIILRDFVAWCLTDKGKDVVSEDLWRFIEAELSKAAIGEYAPYLKDELMQKGGLVFFDGLDEVLETDDRRVKIKQAVEDFAASFHNCRILVTSRTYAYQQQNWQIAIPGITEAGLAPFSRGQIHRFVRNWYVHVAELDARSQEDALGDAELLRRVIFKSAGLMDLARRPLLLTLIASLHAWRGGSLPENREELYADALELLLDLWESPKIVKDAHGAYKLIQPSLMEWLNVRDRRQIRRFLNELAYNVHQRQENPADTADITGDELVAGLLKLNPDPDLKPARLVEYLSERAGVIVPRGVGVYTFPHRTFQEYLAACHLTDVDYPGRVARLVREDPQRWREVALLAGAKSMKGMAAGIWLLAEALCCSEPDNPAATMEDFWGALFAGQMLAENMNSLRIDEFNLPKLDRIKKWQLRIIGGDQLPAVERVSAGNVLSVLGDSRFDPDFWFLPRDDERGFVRIPTGPFLMGSTPEEVETFKADLPGDFDQTTIDILKGFFESEIPRHTVELTEYYIARYPVTVAQYRVFVQDTDHKMGERWDGYNRYNNHPVVYVSWKDAQAYCKWLTGRVKDRGWKVQLPTEAQWEKAARGQDGRIYPWGNEGIRPERANYSDTGIGSTSPVGCFAKGISPYEVLDSIGNVWEWCLDACDVDYKAYKIITDTYRDGIKDPLCEKGSDRVFRGGSWGGLAWNCRAASRYGLDPVKRRADFGFRLVLLPGQQG